MDVFDTLICMMSFLLEIGNEFKILMTPMDSKVCFIFLPFVLWDFQKYFPNEFKNFFLSNFLFYFVIPLLRD